MRLLLTWLLITFSLVPCLTGLAFENLDFEDAMPAPVNGQFQLPADVLPSWTITDTSQLGPNT